MFFTDRQDFSLPVGSYIFCSEAFAFESIFPLIQIKHGLYLSTVKALEFFQKRVEFLLKM